ncbi:MAG TPA: hypothetical protein VMI35_07515 [Puia sp.]|nr:hypothetical protein [Puia sp.]
MSKKMDSLQDIEQEISRLQARTRSLENQLDERLQYLQENYSSLVMKSVFPGMRQQGGIPGSVLELVLGNERFRDSLGKLADRLFDKVSDGIDYLSEKLDRKKEERD